MLLLLQQLFSGIHISCAFVLVVILVECVEAFFRSFFLRRGKKGSPSFSSQSCWLDHFLSPTNVAVRAHGGIIYIIVYVCSPQYAHMA